MYHFFRAALGLLIIVIAIVLVAATALLAIFAAYFVLPVLFLAALVFLGLKELVDKHRGRATIQ